MFPRSGNPLNVKRFLELPNIMRFLAVLLDAKHYYLIFVKKDENRQINDHLLIASSFGWRKP